MALTNTASNVTPTEPQYSWAIMGFSFFIGFSSEVFIKKLRAAAEAVFGEKSPEAEEKLVEEILRRIREILGGKINHDNHENRE